MSDMEASLPVLCLAGPTGAGKTALALKLAAKLQGEVINCDSRQLYRDFPIITAQPSTEEQSHCPHHLYGWLETDKTMDVATWIGLAREKILEVRGRNHVPLLVGGTGMYFQHLLRGIAQVPPVDPALHQELLARLRSEGAPALHEELGKADPDLAARLHPNDGQRIVRGLEVALGTEHILSWWHVHAAGDPVCRGPLLCVNTPIKELEPRLARRIDIMIAMGAVEEAEKAWAGCPREEAPGWSGIGCRELCLYLLKKLSLEEAKLLWLKNTRAYAKRQITWFRGRREALFIANDDVQACLDAFAKEMPA